MFLRENAPDLIPELSRGLSLATVRCSCEYFAELAAFDEILVRMRLAELIQNRITLASNTSGSETARNNLSPAASNRSPA